MKVHRTTYFKRGKNLISGINLPSPQKNVHFIKCDFHPNTWNIKFAECVFDDCQIEGCLTNTKDCMYINE